jgi:hypothetical protein
MDRAIKRSTTALASSPQADPEGTDAAPSAGSYDPGSHGNEAARVANDSLTTVDGHVIP